MATVGQIYYNVIDKRTRSCISSGKDIFSDIVSAYGASLFTKVGIQAKPGTKVIMSTDNSNNNKEIMVGITGIYELDENIAIKSMRFERPRAYQYDEEGSENALKEGAKFIQAAEEERQNKLALILSQYGINGVAPSDPSQPTFRAYWNAFIEIQSEFLIKYNEGLAMYLNGINGIYKLPNENNLEAPENFNDLYDVIIDFIYE